MVENDNNKKDKEECRGNTIYSKISKHSGRCLFAWLFLSSTVQFSIYLNKLYQDSAAVRQYYEEREVNFCAVSAFCLFLPVGVYLIYMISFHVRNYPGATGKDILTETVQGLLLIPRQIRMRVEMLEFAASRMCYFKKPTADDDIKKIKLENEVAVLTFFETFYTGMTQILLQLYIIISSLYKKAEYSALTGEIIASSLCLLSMIVSVRRRDDGKLTRTLSISGWICIMISRSIALSLATTVIWGWMALLCFIHGLGIAFWIFYIAAKTYPSQIWAHYSNRTKFALFWLIFAVLGLPSLVYWPMMFELTKKNRPAIFFCILFVENLLLIFLWAILSEYKVWKILDGIFVTVTAGSFLVGIILIFAYILFKPELTDDVVYYDMKVHKENFGAFFEFCDSIFCIKRDPKVEKVLQEIESK